MEGPTPVSALIHAATMVTAGIFLIIRISPLLSFSSSLLTAIAGIGAVTALCSGLIACYQVDFKKVIAYSTCSQLGYMFFACGLTLYSASLFHLISHGFFKALLFLVAGAYIHLYRNEQTLTKVAFFESKKLNHLYSVSLYIGLVSLSALPFFSGFYSKEPLILQSGHVFFEQLWVSESLGYNIGILAGVLTTTYSASMLLGILQKTPKQRRSGSTAPYQVLSTRIALLCLSIASIVFGFYFHHTLPASFSELLDVNSLSVFANALVVSEDAMIFFDHVPSLPIF